MVADCLNATIAFFFTYAKKKWIKVFLGNLSELTTDLIQTLDNLLMN